MHLLFSAFPGLPYMQRKFFCENFNSRESGLITVATVYRCKWIDYCGTESITLSKMNNVGFHFSREHFSVINQ